MLFHFDKLVFLLLFLLLIQSFTFVILELRAVRLLINVFFKVLKSYLSQAINLELIHDNLSSGWWFQSVRFLA